MNNKYENFYKVKNALKVLNRFMNKYEKDKFVLDCDDELLEPEKRMMIDAAHECCQAFGLLDEA